VAINDWSEGSETREDGVRVWVSVCHLFRFAEAKRVNRATSRCVVSSEKVVVDSNVQNCQVEAVCYVHKMKRTNT